MRHEKQQWDNQKSSENVQKSSLFISFENQSSTGFPLGAVGGFIAIGYRWMVKFVCRVSEQDGVWIIEHAGPDIGPIRVTGSTRDDARRKVEEEIRYWLELCPCSGESYRDLAIELIESS